MNKTLRVHDWDEWQSYRKDRGQPPWIKVHRCIMRDMKWVSLSDAERGQLVAIWLLAADHDGAIPASPGIVAKLCFMDTEPNLNKFIELGLLETNGQPDDATVTPERRQDDAPETEAEADTEAEAEAEAEEDSLSARADRKQADAEFESLWCDWMEHNTPKGPKKLAVEEWRKHVRKAGLDPGTVREAARAYCEQCRRTDTNTQHVHRWIKHHRWEDDYGPPVDPGELVDQALQEKWRREEEEAHASQQDGDPGDRNPRLGGRISPAQIEGTGTGPVRGVG